MNTRFIGVSRIARSFIYRPVAILLAVLLVPSISWFEGLSGISLGAPARSFQASAQIPIQGCNSPRGNKIIRHICVGNYIDTGGDLDQLESDAVNAYLGEHGLPASDAELIYSEGRTDLRNAIRAEMLTILLGIITKPASARTQHEQNLYLWMQAIIQQDEIAEYSSALAEYQKWKNNPCHYTLDPVIAAQYGLTYNGMVMCEPENVMLLQGPYVPAASYFTAYGLENSYGKPAQTTPDFAKLVAESQIDVGEVVGIAAGAGVALATAVGTGIGAFFSSIFPFALGAAGPEAGVYVALQLVGPGIESASTGTVWGVGVMAGPAAIILIAVAIGVSVGMQVFQNQDQLNQLNGLSDLLANAQNNPPDLNDFVNDKTGLGLLKLNEALVAQTLPDVPSTAALPAHNPSDAQFSITPAGGSGTVQDTFSYDDWNGIAWQAQTSGGWFDLKCLGDSSGSNCPQADSFIASLHIVDWNGAKRIASRIGSNFVLTKISPASTDKSCPADPNTGVTPLTDFSSCSSYVSKQVPYAYQGGQYTMQLTNLPVFTGPSGTISFNLGLFKAQDVTITATGTPAPTISLAPGSSLPFGLSLSGGSNGTAQLEYSGFAIIPQGFYQVTLQAQNANGVTTKTFTIGMFAQLQITSPDSATFNYGVPGSFLVTTTGSVTQLTIDPGILFPGLTFHDNGDGSATISGTPTAAGTLPAFQLCVIIPPNTTCTNPPPPGITASNPPHDQSVHLAFSITVNPPPQPQITVPSATFIAGIPNSVKVTTTPTTAPVTFSPSSAVSPGYSWLSFQDNGDGTGVLSGTPPPGTSGALTQAVSICPRAEWYYIGTGTIPLYTCPTFTLNVIGHPVFLSANLATFTVGQADSFTVKTNQSSGQITEIGTPPAGLAFTDNGDGTATIAGVPASGAGGYSTLQLSLSDAAGTATQTLNIQVNEAPKFQTGTTANFYVGQQNSFGVEVSGYPLLSSAPVAQSQTAANYVAGADFSVSGLPGDLSYSNLNPQGYNTGTLTISGTPSSSDVGPHVVSITASNGVGVPVTQILTLNVLALPGDVDGNGVVNCADFDLVRASFGKYRGQPGYNSAADVNNDGVVNIQDLSTIARNVPQGTVCH